VEHVRVGDPVVAIAPDSSGGFVMRTGGLRPPPAGSPAVTVESVTASDRLRHRPFALDWLGDVTIA